MALKPKSNNKPDQAANTTIDADTGEPVTTGLVGLEDEGASNEVGLQLSPDDSSVKGEFSSKDITWPRINIMQKTSKAVENGAFSFLDVVVAGEVGVANTSNACELTVIGARKFWEENLPFDSPVQPQRWLTEAQAQAAGHTTEYVGKTKPGAVPVLVAAVLVRQPEHAFVKKDDEDAGEAEAHFPFCYVAEPNDDKAAYEAEDKLSGNYAVCLLQMKGTLYTAVARPIITALTGRFKDNIQLARFGLKSVKKTQGSNTYGTAVFNLRGTNTPAFAAWAKSLM